ncbi:unnamed protein product [Miscanthus lutarioriparius]|uniref:Uncharacterized protein n=1 Tax=Miscanthus lutarioriparius TaxID=422564 RepID=A0A811RAY4_9POAL|nr:unnamed protein product [Miscanthus lutarioriparius]
MEKKTTLVLYPGFGVGHLSPMLELSKLLLRHGGGAALDVIVVLVQSPFGDPSFDDTVARAKAANTSVAFHVLPSPSSLLPPTRHIARMFGFLRATNAPLRDFLRSLSASSSSSRSRSVRCALVLDTLAVFLALPGMRGTLGAAGFGELGDAVLTFAGVPPLKASELPQLIRDDGAACEASLGLASRMPEARGILLNSFESLEPRAVRALRDGLCVPGRDMPPVYCVGPLVSPGRDKDHGCLRWMDAQPDRSVVFLCFGSMGAFPKIQLEEIAVGLESSGQRFLGRAEPTRPRRAGRRSRPRRAPPGRIPGAEQEQRSRRQELGAAGGRAAAPRGRRVRDALRVELGAGGRHDGPAAAVLATVRGAGAQQGVHRGGDAARGGGEEEPRRGRGRGEGRGGGSQGEGGSGATSPVPPSVFHMPSSEPTTGCPDGGKDGAGRAPALGLAQAEDVGS